MRVSADVVKILDDMKKLEEEAEKLGKDLKDAERQLRVIYETVLKSPDLGMVKPRVMYQAARQKQKYPKLGILANYVNVLVDEVRRRGSPGSEEFERARESLLNFLEAVVAYARYYEKF